MSLPIEAYEEYVKKALIFAYIQFYLQQSPADEVAETLHRIFQLKKKVIRNLAVYVHKEVEERAHPLQDVLNNVSFFAIVLNDFINKNLGQPITR